ncbi:anti-sigma factor [Ideonella azotifigens]|uniref:Anti-sigma factor n=1 Tax=Ideonella azotifigens TaxID=513160 RepID=A0ABP3V7P2_9BURK|nr:anti-sigma factor [Ideonella azotifigens]MCD2342616.1 anti-sigma factor [Ideonella azotifigens]
MTPDPHHPPEDEPDAKQNAELSALLRRHASRHTAGNPLRAAIQTQVALADASRPPRHAPRLSGLRRWVSGWRGPAIGFAAGLACALPVAMLLPAGALRLPANGGFQAAVLHPAELVASHVHALSAGPLYQVASSDRHTVKPWYQGKLDYAPPVPDLSAQGFPLAGGRIEALHGEATAVLAYMRRLHVIDVYVRPSTEPAAAPSLQTERGFHVLTWRVGGMQCWAVSDVEAGELQQFAAAWRARSAGP